jgi:hypothetical protein
VLVVADAGREEIDRARVYERHPGCAVGHEAVERRPFGCGGAGVCRFERLCLVEHMGFDGAISRLLVCAAALVAARRRTVGRSQVPVGFANSRGGFVFVDESAEEVAAAYELCCSRLLERDGTFGR